jgi:4-diphosphocytidyl-2-C-methyl-D-erythritol kinase
MSASATAVDALVEAAPAKINLALHVTGRRADGYHLLDTLVVHGAAADRLTARRLGEPRAGDAAVAIDLTVTGPFAADLKAGPDNLVLRAARLLEAEARRSAVPVGPVALTLEKSLPVASGIGGGSSDAAATLRLLNRVWRLDLPLDRLAEIALPLGADLPMCVHGCPLRARGIGETIDRLDGFPALPMVLVNPRVAVSTPAVFRALERRDNPGLPDLPARFRDADTLVGWLAATRNDLETPAIRVAPVIGDVLAHLRDRPGCRLARMSGSGATCFAIFATDAEAQAAAAAMPAEWWAIAGEA